MAREPWRRLRGLLSSPDGGLDRENWDHAVVETVGEYFAGTVRFDWDTLREVLQSKMGASTSGGHDASCPFVISESGSNTLLTWTQSSLFAVETQVDDY